MRIDSITIKLPEASYSALQSNIIWYNQRPSCFNKNQIPNKLAVYPTN